ncbi:membrane cofactor protein-like isoform X2 [Catharus ustulatus]|uniref:membrane cofactor protein-like isoform X2 n=1 Tax=Catharus ustulatus TaxID=91951 RepID=UPI001407E9FD|nr:membrane cofactor protein-like isoform X2 [Catharus ustulatus]
MGQRPVPAPLPLPVPLSVPVLLSVSVLLPALLLWQLGGAQAPDECPRPERLQYAELDPSSRDITNFPPGTKISFSCRPGYTRVPEKSLTLTCGEDLQWSPTGPLCTARKCVYPGDLENGYFDVTDLTFGSKLTFSCNPGYRIRGNEEITCIIKGAGVGWSGLLPYCEKIPCEPPPTIANGEYEESDGYVYGSSVTYRCHSVPKGSDPFSLIGTATISCTADAHSNGVWSGPPPECRVVKCEDPRVENGRKTSGFGGSYTYGNSVVFECVPGYFLVGAEVITCGENNDWVPPKPTCQKITADVCPPPKIPNGVLVPGKPSYEKGESVVLRCNAGCSFPGGSAEMTVTCQGQGSWGALQHCACESEGSGSTPVISHGRVTDGQKPSYTVGDLITIECYSGYTLHGQSQIQYVGNNQWMPGVPTCQLSGYIIAIICVIVVIMMLLAAFWIYKKFFSQNGSTPYSTERNQQQNSSASQM